MLEFMCLEEKDLQQCTTLFINVFNDEPWNDEWTFLVAYKYIEDFFNTPGRIGVIAVENEEIVGFIIGVQRTWWSGDEFFIHEMCVASQRQHQGIGQALLAYLIDSLPKSIGNITLLTDRGIPAEVFYKKNGFQEIERLVFLNKNISR